MRPNFMRRVVTFFSALIAIGVGLLAGFLLMIALIILLWGRAA
jgi:hypothetical protein